MAFINPNSSFENESHGGPIDVVVPVTGNTIAMRFGMRTMYINPAGTIAALTIKLPSAGAGQVVEFFFTGIVTALTIQDRMGVAVTGAATAATAAQSQQYRFVNRFVGWVRWR